MGYWELPRPHKGAEKQWHVIARVTRTIPFGYEVDPNNDKLLQPIIPELEALELAKNHILQYTYKEVALWLTKQTGRYISGKGLKKRVDIERKRKKAATIKRKLAKRLQETLQEIKNLEEERIGAYTVKSRAATA